MFLVDKNVTKIKYNKVKVDKYINKFINIKFQKR